MRRLLAILGAVLCIAAAADPAERLPDPAEEARARAIFQEVRCLVCQNESIDDSQAELAADLRKLVRDEIKAGRSDQQVRAYLVSRYGEFVLLKPAFSLGNAALWGAPFAVVGLGVLLLLGNLRRRRAVEQDDLSPEEAKRIAGLAGESEE
jgi:cytochrome c-type biogenesis protein CcmH